MSSATLRDELSTDPLARGYDTMTDAEVAADLNTAYRTRQKDSLGGGALWDRTVFSEFDALTDTQKDQWLGLCGMGSVDPYGPAEDLAVGIFGGGSQTIADLGDFREESISRAAELGLGEVKPYDVAKAREQLGVA